MIEYCEAKRFIEALPWPEGTRPFFVQGYELVDGAQKGHVVRLYRPERRFHGAVLAKGPTQEGALRRALARWVAEYKLPPELGEGIGRLQN